MGEPNRLAKVAIEEIEAGMHIAAIGFNGAWAGAAHRLKVMKPGCRSSARGVRFLWRRRVSALR